MTFDEKVFIGLGVAALAAVILFRTRDPVTPIGTQPNEIPATDIVGMSQTPDNSSVTRGPLYLMVNGRYMFAPPLQNFLPTVSSGIGAKTVAGTIETVRRFIMPPSDERIIS